MVRLKNPIKQKKTCFPQKISLNVYLKLCFFAGIQNSEKLAEWTYIWSFGVCDCNWDLGSKSGHAEGSTLPSGWIKRGT